MTLPANYQRLIESYAEIPAKPYLQPYVVPKSPRFLWWSGILMNGVIPYGYSMIPYYSAPSQPSNISPVAPVTYQSTRVFSGQAPVRGIYTGVK